MNTKRLLLGTLVGGAGLALARRLLTTTAPGGGDRESASYGAIDTYIERERRRLNIPGISLAIVEDDRIVHLRGFGRARPGGELPTPQTPFFIASLTKSFTAMAVMQLVETGKIEVDAPVRRYLPWFRVADPEASSEISVRHLLNQTSGLSTSVGELPLADFDQRPDAAERQARALASLVLTRSVGSAFEYSNANYKLLGLIIEAASGERYGDYIQKRIFMPLGMIHSDTASAEAQENSLAVGHQYWFARPVTAPYIPFPFGSLAGGGIISTAEDLAHYLIAHLNGGMHGDARLLSPAGMDELHQGVAELRTMGISVGKYGMGWFESEIGASKLIWHTGILPNFFAYMAILPSQRRGVVLLLNACGYWMSPVLTDFGTGVSALLAGEPPPPSRFAVIPWMLRALVLVPIFQLSGIAVDLLRLHRKSRPDGRPNWRQRFRIPLISTLLAAISFKSVLGERRGFLKLYMPDIFWIANVCASIAILWGLLRTWFVLRRRGETMPS
jgi:CubicO group peptidase (beta-lactamase class C family)